MQLETTVDDIAIHGRTAFRAALFLHQIFNFGRFVIAVAIIKIGKRFDWH